MKNIRLTKCYLVETTDNTGKAYASDFCFGSKAEAEALGEKMLTNIVVPNTNFQEEAKKIREKLVGHTFKHFKGNVVVVTDVAVDTETCQLTVIYRYANDEAKVWARPYHMFMSPVDRIKYPDVKQEMRFEEITEEE